MVFLQNYFNSVLELPLPRNAQKRTGNWKKKSRKKSQGKNEQIFCYAVLRLQQTAEGKKPLTRRTLALYTETRECAFTRCSGGHRFVLDTDTVADLTFRCEGYSDSLLGEAR